MNFVKKIIFFLLLIFVFSIPIMAQVSILEKVVTLESRSGSIEHFLQEISQIGDFYFTYNSVQIPVDKRVFFLSKTQSVKALLDLMFKDCGVEYIEKFNKIILKTQESAVKNITISGIVKDKSCNEVISGVNIRVVGTSYGESSDQNGNFSISFQVNKFTDKIVLQCTHIAFKETYIVLKKDRLSNIEIQMELNVKNIPEIKIFGVPQIAYANTEFQIFDYELFHENILLIVYEKKISKSNLLLVDKEMKVDCIKDISGTPVGMHKDCIGNVNMITFYYPFKISLNAGCLAIKHTKQDWLNKINKPCVAQTSSGLYYYYFYGPARLSVEYSFYNPATKSDSVFRQIKDTIASNELKDKLEQNSSGNTRGNLADLKVGDWDGDDNETSQQNSEDIRKKQLYAPMIAAKDSLYIFNHCDGKIEVFNIKAQLKRTVSIDYFKIPGWKHKIYLDQSSNRFYTCFLKNGIYEINEINEIDINSGKLLEPCKVHFSWIDKIQIHEGNIYFLYKAAQYNFRKCLYKQKL